MKEGDRFVLRGFKVEIRNVREGYYISFESEKYTHVEGFEEFIKSIFKTKDAFKEEVELCYGVPKEKFYGYFPYTKKIENIEKFVNRTKGFNGYVELIYK